jgi:phosphoglycerate dehydrogenase-like enzyme
MGRTVRAYLGGLEAAFIPLMQQGSPGVDFVTDRSTPSEVLAVLMNDRDGAFPGLEEAITPEVRWIHVLGAGVDRFPLHAVGGRTMTCSRGAAAPAIAEFVLAAMLAFEKKIPEIWIEEPPAYWGGVGLGGLRSKTLGLIGLGAIAIETARRALAFEMDVLAFRRTDAPSPLEGVRLVGSLPELLGASDHLVVAAPSTNATKRMLDDEAFAAIKPGTHLINIARGDLIDQDALIRALDSERVAIASLDVCDPEPLPAGHALYTHPKVRLTPHISWSSVATITRTIELFGENLRRYEAGEPLHGLVDVTAGY